MKNKILLCAMMLVACTVSLNVSAQLEVQTSGDVVISKCTSVNGADVSATKAINVKAPLHSNGTSTFGVYSCIKQSHPVFITSGTGIGIYGCTKTYSVMSSQHLSDQQRPTSSSFYAGVVGQSSTHVGVYGTTSNSLPTTWSEGNYAGYFEGNVKVNGTFTPSVITLMGDNRFQENITPLSNRHTVDLLSQMNPVSYTMRQDTIQNDDRANATHYGFVAQELQLIAPELVYEDSAGNLSINYMELIPLLVQKVQDLSAEVEELKNQNK